MPAPWLGDWRRRWPDLAVLAGYAAVAFLYLGLRLVLEPGSRYLGYGGDPKTFIWCFGWWPHAILSGENPFVSHAIWAPDGVNLIWTTSIPGLALLFAPLTLLVGPVESYNVAAVLLPAFAAWTAFLLCRHLTKAMWPALVGGYLFGFSSYVLGQEEGHPHMSAVFLVPLAVLALIRFVEGDLSRRGVTWRLGPLLGLEFLFSTEVAFTLALAIATSLTTGYALLPRYRPRLVELLAPLACAYLFAVVLTAPFVYYAITGFQTNAFHPPTGFVTDLLNFAIPTKLALASLSWATRISNRFPGNDSERDAYLGVPVLLIVALYARRGARTPTGRFLIGSLAVAVVAALGAELTINGHQIAWLPWSIVGNLPLFNNVLPERLAMYVSLTTAIMVALWTAARRPGALRWLLPGLAMLALAPNPDAGVWTTPFNVPAFFTQSTYRNCLASDENILPLPISAQNQSMLWQATSNYRFRMAGGNIAPNPPPTFLEPYVVQQIAQGNPVPPNLAYELSFYIRAKHVTSIIVDPTNAYLWEAALNKIATPHTIGGVILYHTTHIPPCT